MLEEAIPALWASVNSWFTPSFLFVLVNIVIGTIAVTSMGVRGRDLRPRKDEDDLHQNIRGADYYRFSPSVLERLRSIRGFVRTGSGQIPFDSAAIESDPAAAAASLDGSEAEGALETLNDGRDESAATSMEHAVSRSASESASSAKKLTARLIRSVSAMSPIRFEERVEVLRPATTRVNHPPEDEEVDAKADDFINKFRQQLKLQRLESIRKYRDMFNRRK